MYDIIQFQLSNKIIDITVSKIVHSQYDIGENILEIIFDNGEQLVLKMSFEQFQEFDTARNKLVIIEDEYIDD